MRCLFCFFTVFATFMAWAKAPENIESYICPKKSRKSEEKRPVLLHQVNEKLVIGLCGDKEAENGNYSKFDVYIFPEMKKSIFSNHAKNRKFLAMEKKDGMLLIEKIKVDKEYVELFKHEVNCAQDKCTLEKEVCIAINKVKQQWIFKHVKEAKVKSRMKKLGCV